MTVGVWDCLNLAVFNFGVRLDLNPAIFRKILHNYG